MEPDLAPIGEFLAARGLDGYLINDSGANADQRYLSGFGSADPFVSLWTDGAVHLLVRGLDRGLAREESRAASVTSGAAYDRSALVDQYGETEADHRVVAAFLRDHGVESVAVPERFPLAVADGLRALDVAVQTESDDVLADIRAIKTDEEIAHIRAAQRATEVAMARAEELLADATTEVDRLLTDGEPLTSERVRQEIEITLIKEGCALEETIVACGTDAANPHERGSGPLAPNEPIVIDIFPRDRETKYHADMTRTFCVGEPTETIAEWYELTIEAQSAALERIGPGVSGETVHNAVCDVYEAADVPTTRSDESTETGFVHGTGHGVGLQIHEPPRVSQGGDALQPGHVVTIEPGIYDSSVGGIRVEDLVHITQDGYENLTTYAKRLVI